jgi:hypothetical protein
VGELFIVWAAYQPGIERGLDVDAPQPQCLHEIIVHRVFVDVEAGLH